MFWKKKEATVKPTEAEAGPPKSKKRLSPKDIIASKVEQLSPEETITYRLPEVYGGGLAVVELNVQYPVKGKKYFLSLEKMIDGKPSGKRSRLWESNKPKDLAGWIVDRSGELYS